MNSCARNIVAKWLLVLLGVAQCSGFVPLQSSRGHSHLYLTESPSVEGSDFEKLQATLQRQQQVQAQAQLQSIELLSRATTTEESQLLPPPSATATTVMQPSPVVPASASAPAPTGGQIFVCTNRYCREKGADATLATFSFLAGSIPVVPVNCLGRCNKGPNIRILTAKFAFVEASMVRSVETVVSLLQEHLQLTVNSTSSEVLRLNYEGNVLLREGEVDAAVEAYTRALALGDKEQEGVLLVMRGSALLQRAYMYRLRYKDLVTLAEATLPSFDVIKAVLDAALLPTAGIATASYFKHRLALEFLLRCSALLSSSALLGEGLGVGVSGGGGGSSPRNSTATPSAIPLTSDPSAGSFGPTPSSSTSSTTTTTTNSVLAETRSDPPPPGGTAAVAGGSERSGRETQTQAQTQTQTQTPAQAQAQAQAQTQTQAQTQDGSKTQVLKKASLAYNLYEFTLMRALEDLLTATVLLPGFAQAWRRAGDALGELQHFTSAIEYYEVAARLDSTLGEALSPVIERLRVVESIVRTAEQKGWSREIIRTLVEDVRQ